MSVDALRDFLGSLPPGPVEEERLIAVLADAWDRLDRDDTRMEAFKLGRIESPSWDGAVLRFTAERHGWTVMGSTRAEVQHWEVDPYGATAQVVRSTHRQLSPMAPRVDVQPLAQEVAARIAAGADDDRLKWSADRSIATVRIGVILPQGSAARQTVSGRRRRFRDALDQVLPGQRVASSWKYRRSADPRSA